jgi:hypothetical protein
MASLRKKNLTQEQINGIIAELLDDSVLEDGKRRLAHGAVTKQAKKFKMSARSISRLWKQATINRDNGDGYTATSNKKERSGRPILYDRIELQSALEQVPRHERGSMRSVAAKLGVAVSTAHLLIREEKIIQPHSSPLKPYLTEHNKLMRFLYCQNRIFTDGFGVKRWAGAYDEIHVDEKWFFITEKALKVYLTPKEKEENLPQRKVQNKNFITKVMFLAAVARPRFDDDGLCIFDGKIGIWPFVEKVRAARRSTNRPAGTMITKCINVTKQQYTNMILNRLMPVVEEKWPRDRSVRTQVVGIQQDNPNTHIKGTDGEWLNAKDKHNRFKYELREQPANSPDTNILDLGFFRSLQTLQWRQRPATTIDGLIENVNAAWEQYDPKILEKIWVTHQAVCDCILVDNGDNSYELPHLHKARLEREGNLPSSWPVSFDGCEALHHLENHIEPV